MCCGPGSPCSSITTWWQKHTSLPACSALQCFVPCGSVATLVCTPVCPSSLIAQACLFIQGLCCMAVCHTRSHTHRHMRSGQACSHACCAPGPNHDGFDLFAYMLAMSQYHHMAVWAHCCYALFPNATTWWHGRARSPYPRTGMRKPGHACSHMYCVPLPA